MNYEPLIIPAASLLVGSFLAFMATRYWHRRSQEDAARIKAVEDAIKLRDRVADLESQLALVRQSVVPVTTAFQAILIKELTHLHTPVVDALLVKVGPPYTLTDEEERELILAMNARMMEQGSLITESEREAAAMFPYVLKRVKAETALGIGELQEMIVGDRRATSPIPVTVVANEPVPVRETK